MFGGGSNLNKLKSNLRLSIQRLKLLEKKKTEMALKARKEIADYISAGKVDRARIRVEHIIREDMMVEGMEMIEMYCDLLLARFGMIQTQKELDPSLEEPICTLIWCAPRLQAEVAELRVVADQLWRKYDPEIMKAAQSNANQTVNQRLIKKLDVGAPPKLLVEKYLVEIAKVYNVAFVPDPVIMAQDEVYVGNLIALEDHPGPPPGPPGPGSSGGGGGGGGGNFSLPSVPGTNPSHPSGASPGSAPYPTGPGSQQPSYTPPYPDNNPPMPQPGAFGGSYGGFANDSSAFPDNPPAYDNENTANEKSEAASFNSQEMPEKKGPPPESPVTPDLDLPNVPTDQPSGSNPGAASVDFDDLAKRFENLKKK